MNLDIVFPATIENGKLIIENKEQFRKYLLSLSGRVTVAVRKYKSQRSIEQNRYYWGVVVELISEQIGYTADETHEALKIKFLSKHKDSNLPTVISTASMNTAEFCDYTDKVRRWAAEFLGLNIPDPS